MKKLLTLALLLALATPTFVHSVQPDTNSFEAFWQKFKAAVQNKDQNAVAELTQFPLSMYQTSIKTKTAFLKQYNTIFNGEANAAHCFNKEKLEKTSTKEYSIYCGFKKGTTQDDKPIVYLFELTKAGWKFTGFDNVNE